MSFLNPVNEPVLRFSSTDAGAPQINYAARTAGDVKAVLKACLVTGYGAINSAGWSLVNDVGGTAEFVSHDPSMSDYRLGVSDGASSTTWYYTYLDTRVNPAYNEPTKAIPAVNKAHPSNCWTLLVTAKGFIFIESLYLTAVAGLSSRITYFGKIKSAMSAPSDKNMMFFNLGVGATISEPNYFYNPVYPHVVIGGYSSAQIMSAILHPSLRSIGYGVSSVDFASEIYLSPVTDNAVIAKVSGILSQIVGSTSDVYGLADKLISGRPALRVCAGYYDVREQSLYNQARVFLVHLDFWEY